MRRLLSTLLILCISMTAFSQKKGNDKKQFKGFEKSEGGLYYKINKSKEPGKQVEVEDIITISLLYRLGDSVIYDATKNLNPTQLMVSEPLYPAGIMGGFLMMRVGDEGTFMTPADLFYTNVVQIPNPPFVKEGDYLTFEIKLNKAQSQAEVMAEAEAIKKKNRDSEKSLIMTYMAKNFPDAKPTETGLYIIETEVGTGIAPAEGDMVAVHYKGTLLNGEKFDASSDRGMTFDFQVGVGQAISGFDEGILSMKQGGKATLIIPSNLAYGASAPQGTIIQSYSPLRFDLELVSVTPAE